MRILRWCRIDRDGCIQCRNRQFELRPVLDAHLAETWGLTPRLRAQFDEREGHACTRCRMSKRVRMLLWSVKRLFPELKAARILHLNQINGLSDSLKQSRALVETFYDSSKPIGAEFNGCLNQDMQQLQFEGGQFDVVKLARGEQRRPCSVPQNRAHFSSRRDRGSFLSVEATAA